MPILIVSDPETGKSQKTELDASRLAPLLGLRVGEIIDGSIAGLSGHKMQLTGGTDRDGFPLRADIHGGVKGAYLLSGGVGYNPPQKGARKKKTVRGNTVTTETTFLNFKIIEKP